MNQSNLIHCYFVDESGDLTLFNKKGRQIVGRDGVSNFFMLGVAHLNDPKQAHTKLNNLRQRLLDDPYFEGVPSMQSDSNKTAHSFHASKDLPEIRREVFKLLPEFGAKVQVIIRTKSELAVTAQSAYSKFGKKFCQNDVYDDLVKRLFRNLLHKADENHIIIARRGKSTRLKSLREAINRAKFNMEAKWGMKSKSHTKIQPAYPYEFGGLQIIDYYLWALQRLYERGEDRFFNLLRKDYRCIIDIDDKRKKPYGEWYTDNNPLTSQKIKPATG